MISSHFVSYDRSPDRDLLHRDGISLSTFGYDTRVSPK